MKTIKNSLVAAALTLTGCGAAALRDFEERDLPYESFAYHSSNCDPYNNEAKIEMMAGWYKIECDYMHYFEHSTDRDVLRWGRSKYVDDNFDGVVDAVYGAGGIQRRYLQILETLEQAHIHDLWLERWTGR